MNPESLHNEIMTQYRDLIKQLAGENSFLYNKLSNGLDSILSNTLDTRLLEIMRNTFRPVVEKAAHYVPQTDVEYLTKDEVLDMHYRRFINEKKGDPKVKSAITQYFNFVFRYAYGKKWDDKIKEIEDKVKKIKDRDKRYKEDDRLVNAFDKSFTVRHILRVPLDDVVGHFKIGPKKEKMVVHYFKQIYDIEVGQADL